MTALRLLLAAWLALHVATVFAQPPLEGVDFRQRLGAALPLEARFTDADGRPVRLGDYFGQRPVVLVMGYFDCPNLCGVTWRGLEESLQPLALEAGKDYAVVAVSIDPGEGPAEARSRRRAHLREWQRPDAAGGWHFLTGAEGDIRRLAEAVGFDYRYDPAIDQYAHAAGLVVATPEGRAARYLFGVRFPATDLRLALVESSAGHIGSLADRLLLLCYRYDPATGQYGLLIMNVLRGAGVLTVVGLVGFVVTSRRRERRGEGA